MRENTNTDILGIAATSAPTESSGEPSAQLLEGSAIAWIPSLSVQQLVDCDTSFNRGCSGGSPLFAFHYIADHGLVPWSRYEYEEKVLYSMFILLALLRGCVLIVFLFRTLRSYVCASKIFWYKQPF